MRHWNETINLIENILKETSQAGITHCSIDDEPLDGRLIKIKNQSLLNFGSCSYLALEMDQRLKEGIISATQKYGTQFSSSRAYLSAALYVKLEQQLAELFEAHVLVTPTTTLGHFAALPVLISDQDLVVLDQQVHNSVQMAANYTKLNGATVELIRHNNLSSLEDILKNNSQKYSKIWYFADGVYSMYGDFAPVEELLALLNKYEKLHLYIDDAHGMSWMGTQGRGSILGRIKQHERMIVTVSLNKAFAGSGGAIIFPNKAWLQRVKWCGGPMIFSGPIQPPMLGALLASAEIHLSAEIHQLQNELQEKIEFCNHLLQKYHLPLVSTNQTPIRCIGLGNPKPVQEMAKRLFQQGFYVNICVFPAVPVKRGGIRFTLTRHHTLQDITNLVEAIANTLPEVLADSDSSVEAVHDLFKTKIQVDTESQINKPLTKQPKQKELFLQYEQTIEKISKAEWDPLLGHHGTFTWEGLKFLETLFSQHEKPENNWKFHYYIIRDKANKIILATFITESLWKDDTLSLEEVSQEVERLRQQQKDPYYLTSLVVNMGSLLTEGNHLYLDKNANWQEAMKILLRSMEDLQKKGQANQIVLRDLPGEDPSMDSFMLDNGFLKLKMPPSMQIDIEWSDEEGYLKKLSKRSRHFQRYEVIPYDQLFEVKLINKFSPRPSPKEFVHFYDLYKQVKDRGLELNTFDLPTNLFEEMLNLPNWELLLLYLLPDHGGEVNGFPVSIGASFHYEQQYCPMIIGIDYGSKKAQYIYRQSLRQQLKRAMELNCKKVYFGYGATLEKYRLGAKSVDYCMYTQIKDHYHFDLLSNIEAGIKKIQPSFNP